MSPETIPTYAIHDDTRVHGFFGPYNFLSNFWEAEVEFAGLVYPSSENAYQALKTVNEEWRKKFTNCSPSVAKKMGRNLVLRPDWEFVKVFIMHEILQEKFLTHPALADKLIGTGNRHLEETNHWRDNFWGKDFRDTGGWNFLGKLLMKVRSEYDN